MSGRMVHFEIPFDDQERASGFYRETFDWEVSALPELDYVLVRTGPTVDHGPPAEAGFINGGMLPRNETLRAPVLTIEVDDIDDVLATVERQGGATVAPRTAVGDMGFSAYFTDPEGNLLGLWENA